MNLTGGNFSYISPLRPLASRTKMYFKQTSRKVERCSQQLAAPVGFLRWATMTRCMEDALRKWTSKLSTGENVCPMGINSLPLCDYWVRTALYVYLKLSSTGAMSLLDHLMQNIVFSAVWILGFIGSNNSVNDAFIINIYFSVFCQQDLLSCANKPADIWLSIITGVVL